MVVSLGNSIHNFRFSLSGQQHRIKWLFAYIQHANCVSDGVLFQKAGVNVKNNLKIARVQKNPTQQDLAERIGVSRQTINSIETNRKCCLHIDKTIVLNTVYFLF
jgi:hypothetical protein